MKKRMLQKMAVFGLITLMVGVMNLHSAQAQEKRDFFKVGVVTSLSGELVFGVTVTKRGYDMWADTVNQQGGIEIAGKKYKGTLVYADDQSTPATAAVA